MTVLDWICVAILGVSTVFCTFKGFRKLIFKTIAFVLAIMLAKLIGLYLGKAVTSGIINFGGVSKQLSHTFISALGTIIAFLLLSFILKKIFNIVDRKIEPNIQSAITNRILGALAGLFLGTVFVLAFAEIVVTVFTVASMLKSSSEPLEYIDNTIIFKFFRNLN